MSWISYASATKRVDFIDACRDAGLSDADVPERVNDEALGTATWARRVPTNDVAGDLNLQIDVDLAVTNAVALT